MPKNNMYKVAIIGPESTGKSSLSQQLAAHFDGVFVPEYARAYLTEHGVRYKYEDLIIISEGQVALEDKLLRENADKPIAFIDTEQTVMRVWSEFVFNKCENKILDRAARQHYDLYLLCNTDLPWTQDEMREYPNEESRVRLYHHYLDALMFQETPFFIVRGQCEERINNAIQFVKKFFQL